MTFYPPKLAMLLKIVNIKHLKDFFKNFIFTLLTLKIFFQFLLKNLYQASDLFHLIQIPLHYLITIFLVRLDLLLYLGYLQLFQHLFKDF